MNRKPYITLLLLAITANVFSYTYLPNLKSYDKNEYQAGRQNWDIDIDEHGVVYFGNTDGLLCNIYGEWVLKNIKGKSAVRSVLADNDTIWVGGDEYGFFTKDENHQLNYHFLGNIDVGQVWNIEKFGDVVFFQSEHVITRYDKRNDSIKSQYFEKGIWGIQELGSQLWMFKRNGDIGILEGEHFTFVNNEERLNNKEVRRLFQHNDVLYVVMLEGQVYAFDGDQLTLINIQHYPKDESLFSGLPYDEKSFCLGTISSGFLQVDNDGNIINEVNATQGLIDNTVLSMKQDQLGNIWLGLDYGIAKLELQNSINEIFNNGATYFITDYQDDTYLSTNKGLVYTNEKNKFEFVHNTSGQVWRSRVIDNQLYACHNNGLYLIDKGQATHLYNENGVMDIARFADTDYYLFSTYIGVLLMKKEGEVFHFIENLHLWWNPQLVYDAKNKCIWADANDSFLRQIILDDKNRPVIEDFSDIKAMFTTASGLYFYNGNFLSQYRNNQFVKTDNPFINAASGPGLQDMDVSSDKNTIAFIQNNVVHLNVRLPDGNIYSYDKLLSALGNNLVEGNAYIDIHKQFVRVATDRGVMVFDTQFTSQFKNNSAPVISSLKVLNEDMPPYHMPYNNNCIKLDNGNKDFKLNFGIAASKFDVVEYRFRLHPYEDEWSDWSVNSSTYYTQIKGRKYQFYLQSRVNGGSAEETVLDIHIKQMWYQTSWIILPLILCVLLLMLGIIVIMNRINKQTLAKQKRRYQEQEASKMLSMKNEQLLQYTEIISHKNEFLNDVKSGLEKMRNSEAQRWVNRITNEVNNEKKEFLFHKLFSEIHQDFITRITAKYPELTSNDVRLLSFIRINLENREIANLMNISGKSVETNRYRLRKKLALLHEEDLNQFVRDF